MADITVREVDLDGGDYRNAMTHLLLHARADDPMAGLWEAADLQWWWTVGDDLASRRNTFWLDSGNRPLACLLVAPHAPEEAAPEPVYAELLWRPGFDSLVRDQVVPVALQRLANLEAGPDRPVSIYVDERDADLRQRLGAAGFVRHPDEDLVQMWQVREFPPDLLALPEGMWLGDDRLRPPHQPHHLARRNGERVVERLRECSLYRSDLDLFIRTDTGDVAAYCLCWLDQMNGVGLFEPVRTESDFQGRGLGRALLTEGIRRMMVEGANLLKVSRERTNDPALRLYEAVGFHEAFAKLRYVRT